MQSMPTWQSSAAHNGSMQQRPASVPVGHSTGALSHPGRQISPSGMAQPPSTAPLPGFRASGSSGQLHNMGFMSHGTGSSVAASHDLAQHSNAASRGISTHTNFSNGLTNQTAGSSGQFATGLGFGAHDRPQLGGSLFSGSRNDDARASVAGSSYHPFGMQAQAATGQGNSALQLGKQCTSLQGQDKQCIACVVHSACILDRGQTHASLSRVRLTLAVQDCRHQCRTVVPLSF